MPRFLGPGPTNINFFSLQVSHVLPFLYATIMGFIVHTYGTSTVIVKMFMVTFKIAAVALVIVALILLYQRYRSRNRAGRLRRLLP